MTQEKCCRTLFWWNQPKIWHFALALLLATDKFIVRWWLKLKKLWIYHELRIDIQFSKRKWTAPGVIYFKLLLLNNNIIDSLVIFQKKHLYLVVMIKRINKVTGKSKVYWLKSFSIEYTFIKCFIMFRKYKIKIEYKLFGKTLSVNGELFEHAP